MKITSQKRLKIRIKERQATTLHEALDAAIEDALLSGKHDKVLKNLRDALSEQLSS